MTQTPYDQNKFAILYVDDRKMGLLCNNTDEAFVNTETLNNCYLLSFHPSKSICSFAKIPVIPPVISAHSWPTFTVTF